MLKQLQGGFVCVRNKYLLTKCQFNINIKAGLANCNGNDYRNDPKFLDR